MVDRSGTGMFPWWGILREIEEAEMVPSAPTLADADPDEQVWVNVGYENESDEADSNPLGRQMAVEAAEEVIQEFDFDALILELSTEDARRLRERPGITYVKRSPCEPERIRQDDGEFTWGETAQSEPSDLDTGDSPDRQLDQFHTHSQPTIQHRR